MDIAVFRRYLQPSPTLRWHPWAPLVFALVLLSFVFYLGTQWGFAAGNRIVGEMMLTSPAVEVFFRYDETKTGPQRLEAVLRQG